MDIPGSMLVDMVVDQDAIFSVDGQHIDKKQLFLSAVLPVCKVLVIAGIGTFLATPCMNVLHAEARKNISRLVFVLLLPALVFVKLGQGVDMANIIRWYFIPVNVIVGCSVGCLLGYVVCLLCRPPRDYWRLVIFVTGVGNMGNLPLVLVTAVCSDPNNPFGPTPYCLSKGVAYVAFGMWPLAIILWTFVYNSLQLPEEGSIRTGASVRGRKQSIEAEKSHHHSSLTVPLLNANGAPHQVSVSEIRATVYKKAKKLFILLRLHQILRPPIAGALAALVVGAIPPLKHLFFDQKAPLSVFTSSIDIIGQAMIPCLLLVLGANLSGGPGASELGTRTTIGIVVMRLVVLPAMGMGFVLLADHYGLLLVEDKMYRFVLLMQHTMPTSIQVGTAATLRGYGEKEVSAALFWEHIAAVVTITAYLLVYLYLLFPV